MNILSNQQHNNEHAYVRFSMEIRLAKPDI